MTQFGFPYRIALDGRTAGASDPAHVRELIELVLFTEPGERINRPDFGAGVRQLVFGGNAPELAAATEFMIQGALQRWLGDLIQLEAVEVAADDAALRIDIRYRLIAVQEVHSVTFEREA